MYRSLNNHTYMQPRQQLSLQCYHDIGHQVYSSMGRASILSLLAQSSSSIVLQLPPGWLLRCTQHLSRSVLLPGELRCAWHLFGSLQLSHCAVFSTGLAHSGICLTAPHCAWRMVYETASLQHHCTVHDTWFAKLRRCSTIALCMAPALLS